MKKIISQAPPKDENGAYVKVGPDPVLDEPCLDSNLSIDDLLKKGLLALERTVLLLTRESVTGLSREQIQNLKDCMAMLHELKEKEDDLLDNLGNEELEELVKKK